METYKLEVQEFLSRIVEIEAKNSNEAFSKIIEKYRKLLK